MEKPAQANKKSLIWLMVLNAKKEATTSEAVATFEGLIHVLLNYSEYHYVFTIIHDKDPNKRPHLHAVIELYEKATKKAVLDTLTDLLNVEAEQVSLEPSNSQFLGVQYLTHKNQPDKEPYLFEQIRTNNAEELAKRYGEAYQDPEELRKKVLFGSKTMGQLLEQLTIDEAKKVLPVWKEIKAEQGYDKAGLIDQLNKMREDYQLIYDLTTKIFDILEVEVYKNDEATFKSLFGGLKAVFDDLLPF